MFLVAPCVQDMVSLYCSRVSRIGDCRIIHPPTIQMCFPLLFIDLLLSKSDYMYIILVIIIFIFFFCVWILQLISGFFLNFRVTYTFLPARVFPGWVAKFLSSRQSCGKFQAKTTTCTALAYALSTGHFCDCS